MNRFNREGEVWHLMGCWRGRLGTLGLMILFGCFPGCEKSEVEKVRERQEAKETAERLQEQLQRSEQRVSQILAKAGTLLGEFDEDIRRSESRNDASSQAKTKELKVLRAKLVEETDRVLGWSRGEHGRLKREIIQQQLRSRQGMADGEYNSRQRLSATAES